MSQLAQKVYSYDKVPYSSHPYAQSHPQHLYTLGTLFGMTPPDFTKARILELGCASGGNIMPIALSYPKAKCVGVDLSTVQISQGIERLESLKIKNLRLEVKSIMDIDKSFGEFDYIIAHGVYSWVPTEVQEKMLEICSNNLSPNGIAYISYNTKPGWNFVQSLRDMMLYHVQGVAENMKVPQARAVLNFIKKTAKSDPTYQSFVEQEEGLLANHSDYYLAHDHLEEQNNPEFFYQFMERAKRNNLQYLGESSLYSMYLGNLHPEGARALSVITDIERTEQYMDFINNRRFRQTLLCHKSVNLNRKIQEVNVLPLYFMGNLKLKEGQNVDLSKDQELHFEGTVSCTSRSRINSALLMVLGEQAPHAIKGTDLIRKAAELTKITNLDEIREEFNKFIFQFMLGGAISVYTDPGQYAAKLPEKPKVLPLVRYQAMSGSAYITTARHQTVGVDEFSRAMIKLADGSLTVEEIRDKIVAAVQSGELNVLSKDQMVVDFQHVNNSVRNWVYTKFNDFVNLAILEA